jgi:hypothetical protein
MPGPAPNPEARRRNARVGTVKLPAKGRQGDAPPWPVGWSPSRRMDAIWSDLWATPQASAWERGTFTRVVARYVDCLVHLERDLDEIEDPKVYAALLTAQTKLLPEVRQLEDRLGLNPKAMRALLWEVAADELAEARAEVAAPTQRRKLKVAGSDAVAAD